MPKEKIIFTQAYEVQDGTGTRYARGQEVELETASADHFVNRKAALRLSSEEGRLFQAEIRPVLEAKKGAELDQEKVDRIMEAIGALDPENEDHFTNSGLPEVSALKELVEESVSAAERDAAWKQYKAQGQ